MSTAHCPIQCIEGLPLPSTLYSVAVYRRIPTAHYPMQCGSVLNETHCPLPPARQQCNEGDRTTEDPLPTYPCSVAAC